ncbi:hypothetical protein ES703_71980 [subsurface metagenome]
MGYGDVEFDCSQSGSQGGVDVTNHNNEVWFLVYHYLFDCNHYLASLLGMSS